MPEPKPPLTRLPGFSRGGRKTSVFKSGNPAGAWWGMGGFVNPDNGCLERPTYRRRYVSKMLRDLGLPDERAERLSQLPAQAKPGPKPRPAGEVMTAAERDHKRKMKAKGLSFDLGDYRAARTRGPAFLADYRKGKKE
jgi:hypothetical protein